jgi:hypothetical protein
MEKTFNTRAYNTIQILPFGLVEKSSASDRLLDEIAYYDSIPSNVKHLFPRKKDSYVANQKYHLVIEYYPYKNLGEYMLSDEKFDWISVFSNIKEAIGLMSNYVQENKDAESHAISMYITKTKNEYENLKKSYYDHELFSGDKLIINDKEYVNFEKLWDKIQALIEKNLLLYKRTMIHGDMCFSNILYHPKIGSRFIDMRGSFGTKGIYGDSMYDCAKLLHSVEGGYELFINDSFVVEKKSTGVYNIELLENENKQDAFNAYKKIFSDKNIDLIRLVEGLIFVGMCARHYDCKKRQMIMYLTGIKNLNEAMKNLC